MKNISATSNDLIIYDNKGNSYNSLKDWPDSHNRVTGARGIADE